MTLVQLVQQLFTEVGAAGKYPTTAQGASGELQRLINWILQAELDVMNLWVNWKFLRETNSFTTVVGVNTQAAPSDIGEWDFKAFKVQYPGATYATPIRAVEWEQVKHEIFDPADIGPPWRVIVMPDNSLMLQSIPDAVYTITGEYDKAADQAQMDPTNDNAISVIPPRFQRIMVGRGKISYGNYEGAAEQIQEGTTIYTDYLARLENSQLPNSQNARFRTGSTFVVSADSGHDGWDGHGGRW